jgi:hypothetical protein
MTGKGTGLPLADWFSQRFFICEDIAESFFGVIEWHRRIR